MIENQLREQRGEPWAASWLPWFRGEDRAKWMSSTALQPKLYRNTSNSKVILDL